MAIRKASGSGAIKKVRPARVDADQLGAKRIDSQPKASPAETLKALREDLEKATAPGAGRSAWLSEAEAGQLLAKAKAGGPEVEAAFKQDLGNALQSGSLNGQPLQLGDAALQKIAAFAGVAAGAFRQAAQNVDKPAEHQLAEGLVKNKADISQEEVVATKNQIDELRLKGLGGEPASKSEFTPHYKAAQLVKQEIKNAARAHLEENRPDALAAIDAIEPAITTMITKTAAQLAQNPEANRRVAGAIAQVGQAGFTEAMKSAAPDVAKAFTEATGVQAVNPAVVGPLLANVPKFAEKYAPALAPKLTETCAKLSSKLGVTVAKEGAEAVVKAGAKTGAKAGAAGAKAVPGLGNMVSAGCACLAAVGLFKALKASPRDGESIARAGLNTLLQTVGIAFPWVGLAGDVVDMGWSAKKAVTDQQAGKAPEAAITKAEAAGLVGEPAKLLASLLGGAGAPGAAKAFSELASATESAADAGTLERHQVAAFSELSKTASQEVGKAAAQESDPATRDALNTVAHGFGELFKVFYQHKKMGHEEGGKRDELQGQLARVTGDIAMGLAAMRVGGKGATLDMLDAELEARRTAEASKGSGDAG